MKKKTSISGRARPAKNTRSGRSECDNKQLLSALIAFKRGDFSVRLPDDWTGVAGKIADTFNEVIAKMISGDYTAAQAHSAAVKGCQDIIIKYLSS